MGLGARHSSPRANVLKQYIIVSSPQKLLRVLLITHFPIPPAPQSSAGLVNSSSKVYRGPVHFSSYPLPPFWSCVVHSYNLQTDLPSVTFSTSELLTMLPNSGSAACHSKANNREASVSRKERCFNQKSRQSGEKVDSCPKSNSEDSCSAMTVFKGKGG